MNYVGLDIHARSFSVTVVEEDNQILFKHSSPISATSLQGAMQAIPHPKPVVLEESTVAAWAFRVLEDHA